MKKILLSFILLSAVNSFCQESVKATYENITNSKERPKFDNDITEYIAKDGSSYKVGDILTIGIPTKNNVFAFISTGDGIMMPLVPATISLSGQKTEIIKFKILGTKKAGFTIWLKTKSSIGINNFNIDFENAIANQEIVSYGMTSDQALSELKKAKDKYELELITKEQYDLKKAELSKFIK
ncbi:hypothetical protein J2Y38_004701 [Flavobacterium sp. 2755]|uniref:hypothetical protein n=1 Tax=Flavobacterium sp. 2755 TaxID=2817765 RepID=UPI002855B3C5|nr:hypothetical protein [Flavobacterium sp. 2755]MDR6764468.1 hypothetical protein [Flavobacterium sp. 2755]